MFIIAEVKELSIWLTETPFQKKSGVWYTYDTREEYEDDLAHFKDKYGTMFLMTLKRVKELYKQRGGNEDE